MVFTFAMSFVVVHLAVVDGIGGVLLVDSLAGEFECQEVDVAGGEVCVGVKKIV